MELTLHDTVQTDVLEYAPRYFSGDGCRFPVCELPKPQPIELTLTVANAGDSAHMSILYTDFVQLLNQPLGEGLAVGLTSQNQTVDGSVELRVRARTTTGIDIATVGVSESRVPTFNGAFTGYAHRDVAAAQRTLDYLNTFGRQISKVLVTFAPGSEFAKHITNKKLRDGRCATTVIVPVGGHTVHFDLRIEPHQMLPTGEVGACEP